MFNYVKESYNELVNKVTWPTFPQLQSSTIVVMVASVIFAVIMLAMEMCIRDRFCRRFLRIPYFGFLFCFCKNTKKIGTGNAGFRQCAPPCAGSVPELRW